MDLQADERPSDSPFVDRIWYSYSDSEKEFTSIAQTHWWMVVTKHKGRVTMTVRGPETFPTTALCPADAEWVGIQFKMGTLMPYLPPKMVMNRCDVDLPEASNQSFWLNGGIWQIPDYENADTFVDKLVREGLIQFDPVVASILQGEPVSMSLRTVQRRFLQATGLNHGTIAQIQRARYATRLLKVGTSILDTVVEAGYADQPHLTRSLKQFVGETPAPILSENAQEPMSLLFKTEPF